VSCMALDMQANLTDQQSRQALGEIMTHFQRLQHLLYTMDSSSTSTLGSDALASEHPGSSDLNNRCLINAPQAALEGTRTCELATRVAAEYESRMAAQYATVETISQDMRCSLQEATCLPAATAEPTRAELKGELHQLLRAELHSADAKMSIGLTVSSLFQRLDALESAGIDMARRLSEAETLCQDMRCSLREVNSVPAATTELIKAVLGELHQLREQLDVESFQSQADTVSSLFQRIGALELAGIDTTRRLSEAEAVINAETDKLSEIEDLRTCMTSAVKGCEIHFYQAEVLRAQLKREVATETSNIVSEKTKRLQEVTNRLQELFDAEQIELSKTLRDAASTAAVTFVSESAAEPVAASIRRVVEEGIAAKLSGLETGSTNTATSTSKSGMGACNLSHLQATISACAETSKRAQAEIEGVKKRVLALEKANASFARQIDDAEAHAPTLCTWSQQHPANGAKVKTPSPPRVARARSPSASGGAAVQVSAPVHVASKHTSDAWPSFNSVAVQYASCSALGPEMMRAQRPLSSALVSRKCKKICQPFLSHQACRMGNSINRCVSAGAGAFFQ